MSGVVLDGAVVRVGISGWRYPPWRGEFYPPGLPQRRELEHASRHVQTIEVNGSFYSLQRPSLWRRWRAEVPQGFLLAVKGPRFVTHLKRLRDCEVPLANFYATGPLLLGEALGPFLWQLPPTLALDTGLLEDFLALLPRTEREAAALARRHDARLDDHGGESPWTRAAPGRGDTPLRHAVEGRHPSFADPAFADVCRRHGVAVVVTDGRPDWPALDVVTADHVYVRLHGAEELYVSGYSPADLERWARRVRGWAAQPGVRLVDVYFDNDAKVRAPYDAQALAALLAGAAVTTRG